MRQLLNTLFVTTAESYLSLENENVVVNLEGGTAKKFPLRLFEQIYYFGFKGISPALMGECAKKGIALCIFNPHGRFQARVTGRKYGNVLLRKEQYRISDDLQKSCLIARNFIVGKIYNSRGLLERAKRDHPLAVNVDSLNAASKNMLSIAQLARSCTDMDKLRGYEGEAASIYFANFNDMILQLKDFFRFSERIKRPPLDPVNSLLSFVYVMLANDCASALEGAGLDPYVGFLHRDRPGRPSLALDLMEEFRSVWADRLVLTLINNRVVNSKSFEMQENGAVLLTKDARKAIFDLWQDKKRVAITHPFLQEKVQWGLVIFLQAQLLARHIRGDLDQYPVFMWK